MVQVESEFRIIKIRIFLNVSIILFVCRVFESVHGSHLVLQFDIAVCHLVIRNLSQRVASVIHLGIVLDSTFVVGQCIEQRSCIEVVLPGS